MRLVICTFGTPNLIIQDHCRRRRWVKNMMVLCVSIRNVAKLKEERMSERRRISRLLHQNKYRQHEIAEMLSPMLLER